MREVTSDYLSQVKSGARQFGFYVNIYGNSATTPDTLWLGDIISIDIVRSASDQLQIGACMSDKLTLQTRATTLFNGRGKKVVVYYRCTAPILGWVRLGTFYVDECVTEQGITAVTAYDMMSRLDKRISWGATSKTEALTFPCKMQAMLNYICARAGVTTDFTCQDITVENTPDGYTARELISYIAASHGGNARFSPSEVLQIRPYTQTTEVIEYGRCYSMDAASDSGYTVNGILFDRGGDDKIYIDGTSAEYDEDADGVVQAFNPFATVGIAEYAWTQLGGLNYSAVSLEMPAVNILEPGDVFIIKTSDGAEKTAIVMEQTLSVSCTGGFVESISCTAESKNQTRNAENRAEATEKEIKSGVAEKLHTSGSTVSVDTAKDPNNYFYTGVNILINDVVITRLDFKQNSIDISGANGSVSTGYYLHMESGYGITMTVDPSTPGSRGNAIQISKSRGIDIFSDSSNGSIKLETSAGAYILVNPSSQIFAIYDGKNTLSGSGAGLYYNGKKVLTEE